MRILVLNAGGSSFKYKLYQMPDETLVASGDVDRLGTEQSLVTHRHREQRLRREQPVPDHLTALRLTLEHLTSADGPLDSLDQLDVVGHKLPHGGEAVMDARLVDEAVEQALERLAAVVPVHNPPALTAIRAVRELLPATPQCGTFETHFHRHIAPARYRYALPESWYREHGIRRFGFHSCSHRYVTGKVAELLGQRPEAFRLTACHLGSGTSVCGVRHGRSVEISSAFTPQAGTPMSTRPGDFDPFVITYLMDRAGLSTDELNRALTRESGLAGVSGIAGGDLRDIEQAAAAGDERAQLALDLFVVNILRWVGCCLTACGGIDVLSFAGGIGENDALLRRRVAEGLDWLGCELDETLNQANGSDRLISTKVSRVAVAVVHVDEEIIVARDAYALLGGRT